MPIKRMLLIFALGLFSQSSHAAWFEASGQAVVTNNDRQLARQNATREAITQALLFAGASVKSVQTMTNGLLHNDRFEVRASGEVSQLELIDEHFHGDMVTVTVRADIFPQERQCDAADYRKSIITHWFPIENPHEAAVGDMFDFGRVLPQRLQLATRAMASNIILRDIERQYLMADHHKDEHMAVQLSRKSDNQYVLLGRVSEFGLNSAPSTGLAFWKTPVASRRFALDIALYEGQTGELIMEKHYETESIWEFDVHQRVPVTSNDLWESDYGITVLDVLKQVSLDVDEALACEPAYGRILKVTQESLQINIGSDAGVQVGDILTLFQLQQFYDPIGNLQYRYHLNPVKVTVTQVFGESAVARAEQGQMLANIQANDFVARM